MPIKIPNNLPAANILKEENIFVMYEERAYRQDIRPLKLLILNLMPTKIATETQLLRLLGNSPLQVEIDLLYTASYKPTNTPEQHLLKFYATFDEVKHRNYDGMIITGAPIEQLPFEQVAYWPELCEILVWSRRQVYSTFHICWGAQAALYYHYGIPKYNLAEKMFGVFATRTTPGRTDKLFRGFDDLFYVPHSRHTTMQRADLLNHPELKILAESEQAGAYIITDQTERHFFITGHAEYDPLTLKAEYERDLNKQLPITIPANYFRNDDPAQPPVVRWRSAANLLFSNWLNYYVYQETPFDLAHLGQN